MKRNAERVTACPNRFRAPLRTFRRILWSMLTCPFSMGQRVCKHEQSPREEEQYGTGSQVRGRHKDTDS